MEKYQQRAVVAILVLVYALMRAATALRSFYFFQRIERLELEARRLSGLTGEGPAGAAARGFSWNSKMFCAGTGRTIAALPNSLGDSRGHGACGGSGIPCARRLGRSNGSASRSSCPSCHPESCNEGAGSVPAPAKTNLGILGQCEIATVSEGGCNCHCGGSVGVFGCCPVAGTTWTMR